MKALALVFGIFCFGWSFAQPNFGPNKADSCWKRSQERSKNRFAEWECGKIAGVVDCNEKLELDPNTGIVMTSGNHKPFTGICETCHMNGMKERTVTFVEGRANGIDTTTYRSGCLMAIRSHIQGVEDGRWVYYFDSTGYVSWEHNYSMGELNGPQYSYAYNGDTIKIENYSMGVLQGARKSFKYNPATKHTYLEKVAMYKNGLLDGPFLIYNPEGVIIEETSYKEGKKNGVFKYYYDDGVLLRTENWVMDSRNGEFKTLYYDQSLQSLENYKKSNGKPQQYLSADIYTFASKEVAYGVGKIIGNKGNKAKIDHFLDSAGVKLEMYSVKDIIRDTDPNLKKSKKLGKGVNEPFVSGPKGQEVWILINLTDINTVSKTEVREGWFEERFPDGKLKRRALYRGDILIEETVYDQLGKIVSQYGVTQNTGKEDDEMPAGKTEKKKKEKKTKEKKPKKSKEETPKTGGN
jgi:antitoxin component YwqK of YwqJK toxin-antitoxin module